MPELPEVQALVDFLAERTDGLAITTVELASFSVLKTFNPPPQALEGSPIDGVHRHGKFLDIDADGTHLVFHLARAGWLRWSDQLPTTVVRPGKSPIALRVRLSDGSGFDLTEAGTKKSLAAYIVKDPADVPASPGWGPTRSPTTSPWSASASCSPAVARRSRPAARPGVHRRGGQRLLRRDPPRRQDQPLRARRHARPEVVDRLYAALRDTLKGAVATASGKPAKELKDAKRAGMRVHAHAQVRPAPSAVTPCVRCPSPTPRCSTARPARRVGSHSPTDG